MSSANLVRLAMIEESEYGVTPNSGDFSTIRFTSEGISGTPETVESQQIRVDRMSSGQVVTGLKVEGEFKFELAKEDVIDSLIESAMLSTWDEDDPVTVTLAIDISERKLTRSTGSWNTPTDDLVVGDFITLAGFTEPENNVTVQVTAIDDDDLLFVGPAGMSDSSGGTGYQRADRIGIGTTPKSFSIEKAFIDMEDNAIAYRGMLVNSLELNVAYGELISGSFGLVGNGRETFDDSDNFITHSLTIADAATTDTMNGSIDMPFLSNSSSGTFGPSDIDIQSVKMKLNNNNSPLNSIGHSAPTNYSPGTAAIEMSISTYLSENAWGMLAKKISQESFALGFMVQNGDGFYGFYIPSIQVSFEDPSSGGQNQQVSLEMNGRAKVGDNGESALVLYKSVSA